MVDIKPVLQDFLDTMSKLDEIDLAYDAASYPKTTLIAESVFLIAWRTLEQAIAQVFFHYCCGGASLEGNQPKRYVEARDRRHAEDFIRGERVFIEWNSFDAIIKRCEIFFEEGGPIKASMAAYRQQWVNGKSIRNHIAHGSTESSRQFANAVRSHLNTMPIPNPSPGDFLLRREIQGAKKGTLIITNYLDFMTELAKSVCHFEDRRKIEWWEVT